MANIQFVFPLLDENGAAFEVSGLDYYNYEEFRLNKLLSDPVFHINPLQMSENN